MKKLLLLAFVMLGLSVYSQDETPVTKNPDQKTIKGALYTDQEREKLITNFFEFFPGNRLCKCYFRFFQWMF